MSKGQNMAMIGLHISYSSVRLQQREGTMTLDIGISEAIGKQ